MRKCFCVLAVALALCCQSAFADVIVNLSEGGHASTSTTIDYTYKKESKSTSASAFKATSDTSGYPENSLFCGDLNTGWGDDFKDETGINFKTLSVTERYGDTVGGYLQTLYNHAYDSILNQNGRYNITNVAAFQMAVWEIILDGDSGTLSRTKGDLSISSANSNANKLADDWLKNISNGTWTADNAEVLCELTVYVPVMENGTLNPKLSQTLIGVKSERDNTTTPEPATLAILGFGLLGAGIAAHRKRA